MDQSGAQHFAEALMSATKTINGQTIWGDGNITISGGGGGGNSVIQTTYSAFQTSVTSKTLTPGAFYMITDYQAVPNATYVKKAPGIALGSVTYLIIQALTDGAYDENASLVEVIRRMGTGSNISVYNIKYTIENKYFIDQNSGHGTITYMRDVASGNTAPWDWRMGRGIVSKDATATAFVNCTNCTIACGDSDNVFPCITLTSCTDCNIGPNNTNINLRYCERVNIKNDSRDIYLQYVHDCNIGSGCDNIHLGEDSEGLLVERMNIGNACSFIFVLPASSTGSTNNVIGNNCSYIQFVGSNITIGNNCGRIYLSGKTRTAVRPLESSGITVGNDCNSIGSNTPFSSFDSFQTNNMHFNSRCSIGDSCMNIIFPSIASSIALCKFSNCSFQNINGFYIKIPTTEANISDKSFKHIYQSLSYPLNLTASTPANWKTQAGDISYDATAHKFALRYPTSSTWTNIQ